MAALVTVREMVLRLFPVSLCSPEIQTTSGSGVQEEIVSAIHRQQPRPIGTNTLPVTFLQTEGSFTLPDRLHYSRERLTLLLRALYGRALPRADRRHPLTS